MLAVVSGAGVAWAVSRAEPRGQSLGALLDRVVDEGAPGVLVVVRDGDATQAEARGLADRGRAMPMAADVRFRTGSITKTFVAALVLDLVADGKLRLDDPVARWVPGLVPRGNEITVRQLLRHTSGLADYVDDPRVLRAPARLWRPEELVAMAAAQPEAGAPGERFAYASTNYVVLGLVAERAGRAPLAMQLTRRLSCRSVSGTPHTCRVPSRAGAFTGIARRRTREWSRETRSRWALRRGGREPPAPSSRLRRTSSVSSRRSSADGCSARNSFARWRLSFPPGGTATASGSRSFRPRAARRGVTRETSRAPSPSPGIRATRLVGWSSW